MGKVILNVMALSSAGMLVGCLIATIVAAILGDYILSGTYAMLGVMWYIILVVSSYARRMC